MHLPNVVRGGVSDEGVRGDVHDGDRLASGEGVILGGDQHRFGCEHRVEVDIRGRDVFRGDDEIEFVVPEPPHPLLPGTRPNLDSGAGASGSKPCQVLGQQVRRGGLAGSNPEHVSDGAMVFLGKGVGEEIDTVYQRHGALVENPAELRQVDAGSMALEQPYPELFLQCTHQGRDRRLARQHAFRRARDVSEPRRVTERAKLLQPVALVSTPEAMLPVAEHIEMLCEQLQA